MLNSQPAVSDAGRIASVHRATFTRSKFTGETQVRLVGPQAADAAGCTIPVTRKDGSVDLIELGELVFTGTDDFQAVDYEASYQPLAIYKIKRKPREKKPFSF